MLSNVKQERRWKACKTLVYQNHLKKKNTGDQDQISQTLPTPGCLHHSPAWQVKVGIFAPKLAVLPIKWPSDRELKSLGARSAISQSVWTISIANAHWQCWGLRGSIMILIIQPPWSYSGFVMNFVMLHQLSLLVWWLPRRGIWCLPEIEVVEWLCYGNTPWWGIDVTDSAANRFCDEMGPRGSTTLCLNFWDFPWIYSIFFLLSLLKDEKRVSGTKHTSRPHTMEERHWRIREYTRISFIG